MSSPRLEMDGPGTTVEHWLLADGYNPRLGDENTVSLNQPTMSLLTNHRFEYGR